MTAPTSRPSAYPREAAFTAEMHERATAAILPAFAHVKDDVGGGPGYRAIIAGCWARAALNAALRDRTPDHPDPGSRAMPEREEIARALYEAVPTRTLSGDRQLKWEEVKTLTGYPYPTIVEGQYKEADAVLALFSAPQRPELVRPTEPGVSNGLVERPWRCDVTGNCVGTDTRMIGAPPCDCQGCRAADHTTSLNATIADLERQKAAAIGIWQGAVAVVKQLEEEKRDLKARLAGALDALRPLAAIAEPMRGQSDMAVAYILVAHARAAAFILDTETGHGG